MTTGKMATKRLQELKGSRGHSRKEKPGSTKRADRTTTKVLHGWDLPLLQDENDIVNWMKREKNGDNKRKPRPNEDLPEESYRHDFLRCRNLDNQMEFERQSLHERYRKNCQVGAKPMEVRNSSNWKKQKDDEMGEPLPARKLPFPRSCKSAELPMTPKISTLQQIGLGFPDSENTTPIVLSRSHSVIDDSRLKSYGLTLPPDVKTLRLLELAEKFTAKGDNPVKKGRGQKETSLEEPADEGYDSKVSSNDVDVEEDAEGSKVAQFDGASVYTNLDSILPEQTVLDTLDTSSQHDEEDADKFQQFVTQNLAHTLLSGGVTDTVTGGKDSIAKLIYSRRDLNVYERSPSRRKDTSFKYAGKEQSRLMETSLNNITPGYLNMHQLATLTSLSPGTGSPIQVDNQNQLQMLFRHYAQQNHGSYNQHNNLPHHHHHHHHQHHQHHPCNHSLSHHHSNVHDKQNQSLNKPAPHHLLQENVDQKQLAMRRICLQDATGNDVINSHTLIDNPNNASVQNASPGSINKQRRIRSGASINDEPVSEMHNCFKAPVEDISDDRTGSKEITHADPAAKTHLLRVQDMSSKISLPNKNRVQGRHSTHNTPDEETLETLTPSPRNMNDNVKDAGSSSNNNNNHHSNISSVLMKYFNKKSSNSHVDNSKMDEKGLLSRGQDGVGTTGNTPHTSEKVSAPTFFPVADLLPAVENNLRRRKKRGLGKQTSLMYRSHTMLDSNLWKKEGPTATTGGEPPTFNTSYPDLSNTATTSGTILDELTRSVFAGDRNPLAMQKANGPPKFRPHVALSPLQRAKEIASRRIHGYLAKYPDGPEQARVASPQYMSSKMGRVNSASRRLGHMMNASWK